MKTQRIIPAFGLIIALLLTLAMPPKTLAQPGVDMPVESFYDELAPYGQWSQNPTYGQVWTPDVPGDFQPYATNGHWAVTEYGNTWVSDYDWGWAPFHYGRWQFDDYYGRWIWIPDTQWGPAWVSWRTGGGYYGWAPLGPGMSINVNINLPVNYWTFVPQMYFTSPRVYSYCIPRTRVVNIYRNTTIINNVYRYNNRSYGYGPRREEIERYTRQSVPVYRANDIARRGSYGARGGNSTSYRPDNRGSYNGNGGYNGNNRGEVAGNYPNGNRPNRYDNDRSNGNFGNRNDDYTNRPNSGNGNRPEYNNRPNGGNDTRPDYSNRPNAGIPSGGAERPDYNNRDRAMPNRVETPAENRGNQGGYNPGMSSPPAERRSESRPTQQPDQFNRRERPSGFGGNEGAAPRPERSRDQYQQRSPDQPPRQYQERQNSSNRGEGGGGSRRGPQ
ncbi:hypothetical protein GCM10028803_22660 [Larkinella knui]|uniref:Uncharacterized protein n=1 Tax=Larkinella knui TaxID=2025310 RepID=A0A3P1CW88_9BACT|nr:DUF6600 domain-containing protein [Larkinella knui]RRB17340.1 hypothetical protein EHT87_03380 [Larkinella knui]